MHSLPLPRLLPKPTQVALDPDIDDRVDDDYGKVSDFRARACNVCGWALYRNTRVSGLTGI